MAHALRQTTAVHTRFGPVSGRSYKAHGLTWKIRIVKWNRIKIKIKICLETCQ
jgi:hypothetical protein